MTISATPLDQIDQIDQSLLQGHFLTAMRQRFKAEVNRLTSGDMLALLGHRANAQDLAFVLSYLYVFHWLRVNVPANHWKALLAPFSSGSRGFLMELLTQSPDAASFVRSYIQHWLAASVDSPVQRTQLLRLLDSQQQNPEQLERMLLQTWDELQLFTATPAQQYRQLGHQERSRYRGLLGAEDQERLALLDALKTPAAPLASFAKLGLVPTMGCRHTCRHCMFIWRPPMSKMTDLDGAFKIIERHTDSLLFTGGDLTGHLELFYQAIRTLKKIRNFAILLNGDFAVDLATTRATLQAMEAAIQARPKSWPCAKVLLQISFDELHQEILPNRAGLLHERIPVARIANIVETAPHYPRLQLCLLHKQNILNFSMDVLQKGVFARLVQELGRRGHQVQVLTTAPSPRLKVHPLNPAKHGQVLKDASFILTQHPDRPILFTSSTIDGYGRAALLETGESINERELLAHMLANKAPTKETFDIDLMLWANGWVTLFSAAHICLGDWRTEDSNIILERQRKDPLTVALRSFDRTLLTYYGEVRTDLEARIAAATGPQHLFHMLTEEPKVRLHMTQRLL